MSVTAEDVRRFQAAVESLQQIVGLAQRRIVATVRAVDLPATQQYVELVEASRRRLKVQVVRDPGAAAEAEILHKEGPPLASTGTAGLPLQQIGVFEDSYPACSKGAWYARAATAAASRVFVVEWILADDD